MSLINIEYDETLAEKDIIKLSLCNEEDYPDLVYEANEDFNQYIDEQYINGINIYGSIFQPSKILYELDNENYRIALQEFRAEEI
ncbi:hypothetical protein [Nostoc sp.]|uniref:hypothetical protein n=1 Tax=Nostoc sp. TaxID=1180 RepID=UPI002FFC002F